MYIVTENNSAIPVTAIKAVKPKKDGTGSVIHLKSGERISDPRGHCDVLKEAYQDKIEIAPLIDAISAITQGVAAHQVATDKAIASLVEVVNASIRKADSASTKLIEVSTNMLATSKDLKTSGKHVNSLARTINDAIQEI